MRERITPQLRCRRVRYLGATCACVAVLASAPTQLSAGVFCGDRVTGGATTAPTKEAASAAATAWWSSRAGALGRGYESWNAATEKRLTCVDSGNGSFTCTASAKPCLPDGTIPDNGKRLDL